MRKKKWKIFKNPFKVYFSSSSSNGFIIEIPTSWLLSLVINPILRILWRNLKEKMRRSRFFFRVGEGREEEEFVLNGFRMK